MATDRGALQGSALLRFVALACCAIASLDAVAGTVNETDMAVLKTGPAQAAAGGDVAYTITVVNLGSIGASDVVLTDPAPADTTFVSLSQDSGPPFDFCATPIVGGSGTITCSISTLAPSAGASFTVTLFIYADTPAGTTLTNTATVDASTPDPDSANDSSVVQTQVTFANPADMQVSKVGPASATPNGDVTYSIGLGNAGPAAATDVLLSDTLPDTMTFVSLNQEGGPQMSCTAPAVGTGGTVSCSVASFPANEVAMFLLTTNIPPETPSDTVFTNVATVTSASDPNDANNEDRWVIPDLVFSDGFE